MKAKFRDNYLQKIPSWALILLIAFLAISSWLVSYSGIVGLSAVRDLLAFIIFIVGVTKLSRIHKKDSVVIITAVFIIYGILSYFWREASAEQWLRGWRFLYGPFILLCGLSLLKLKDQGNNLLHQIITAAGIVTILISSADIFGISLPLISRYSNAGALLGDNYVGMETIKRVQGIMSGPNALGLYLLSFYAYNLAVILKNRRSYLAICLSTLSVIFIILTFSRSCLIGMVLMTAVFIYKILAKKWGAIKSIFAICMAVLILSSGLFCLYKNHIGEQYFTHNSSSMLRAEQYQRIWQQSKEIGFFGRGLGTAGPSSQNRLDGGENHWTENIYLDVFEELGILGLLLFFGLLVEILRQSYNNNDTFSLASFLVIVGFIAAGLFINIYTGQAGWWMVIIYIGLSRRVNVK